MVQIQAIFLDDGGVLNDNEQRAPQWRELDAQFYASRYGGDHDAWVHTSQIAFEEFLKIWREAMENPETDYQTFWKEATEQHMTTLFNLMEIPPLPLDEQYKVAREADEWIAPRLKTAFPGAIQTVRYLKERGYLLYTASGGTSWQIRGYLTGMGIIDCFEELYGSDIINTMKSSSLFYQRIFEHANIQPKHALVADDHRVNVIRAKEVGATAVLVSPSSKPSQDEEIHSIQRLDGLPRLLTTMV
jgi:FMN phosphatase YigB (HAD superfamily)